MNETVTIAQAQAAQMSFGGQVVYGAYHHEDIFQQMKEAIVKETLPAAASDDTTAEITPEIADRFMRLLEKEKKTESRNAMRYGSLTAPNKIQSHGGGCYAGLASYLWTGGNQRYDPISGARNRERMKRPRYDALYCLFHGDGPEYTFEELANKKKQLEKMKAYARPFNTWEGTERSKSWVSYLLSPTSPWARIHPFLVTTDPEWINQNGFIFKDVTNIPNKLLYNFAMTERFPWECPDLFSTWCLLRERMNENLALWVASMFIVKEGSPSIEAEFEAHFPWSFLEAASVETAGRFIFGQPNPEACKPKIYYNGCVEGLWNTAHGINAEIEQQLWAETVSLSEIETLTMKAAEAQRSTWKDTSATNEVPACAA